MPFNYVFFLSKDRVILEYFREKGCTGELTVQEGYEATQHTLLNALAIIRDELGSLEQIKKVVRMTGYVASAEGFTGQPAVVNGASDLLVQLFGENGRHARVAVGVAELPLGAPVELELIVECYSS